jgi:hypothetical protein
MSAKQVQTKSNSNVNTKQIKKSCQIIDVNNYDVNNIIFGETVENNIPGSAGSKYSRIQISTLYNDGTMGDLLIPTGKLFSFGIQANTNQVPNSDMLTLSGYGMSLALYSMDGPTEGQLRFVKLIKDICMKCKERLVEKRMDFGKPKIDIHSDYLESVDNILHYPKTEKGGKITNYNGNPTISPKLIWSSKTQKFSTTFYQNDQAMSSDELKQMIDTFFVDTSNNYTQKKNYCWANCVVKIESIFIGKSPSIQLKLYECELEFLQQTRPRLLPRAECIEEVSMNENGDTLPMDMTDLDIKDPEEIPEDKPVKTTTPVPVSKTTTTTTTTAPVKRSIAPRKKVVDDE